MSLSMEMSRSQSYGDVNENIDKMSMPMHISKKYSTLFIEITK